MRFLSAIITALLLFTAVQSGLAQSSRITVKGVVTDKATGEPAIGISILAGSPPKPVGITDTKGAFSVTVEAGAVLTFRGLSYADVHKKVTESTNNLEITIAPSSKSLNEVVITGYTKKTRATTTGAVTRISGEEIQDVPVANVMQLIQGKVAGLNIQVNTGAPGAMGRVQVRGLSSTAVSSDGFLTPTSPLFIVDGVPVDANQGYSYGFNQAGPGISPLALIPPEDIASVEVLKDAAATSIYGSRGAYGVIVITTKRGKSRVPIVRYTGNFFFNTPPKLRTIIGGKRERQLRIWQIMNFDTSRSSGLALINNTPFLSDSLNPYYNNSTNWQDIFYRPTYNMSHNLSISGGDEEFNYKTNLNYYQENGIVKNTGFKRYSLNMNARYQPSTRFRMMATLNLAYGKKNNGSGVGLLQKGVADGVNTSSLMPPPSMFSANNAALSTASIQNDNKTANVKANLNVQWEPIKGVRLADVASYDYSTNTSDRFSPSYLHGGSSEAYSYSGRDYTLYNRATLNYTKILNQTHTINAFIFDEIQKSSSRANAFQIIQTPNNEIHGPVGSNWYASGGGTLDNLNEKRIHGYGGALSYNYDTKYIFNFSFRFDGTSTNGPSKGYSKNPAVSVRWNFNREHWFDDVSWLSYSSLRASWGKNIVPTGDVFDVYGRYSPGGTYNGQPTMNLDYGQIPNTNFLPKTTTTTNVGFEGGIFNNRFEWVLDAYYKSVDNMLTDVNLPKENGFNTIKTNAISLVNYGYEWTFTYRIFPPSSDEGALQSTISINGAMNKDVLTHLPQGVRQMKVDVTSNGQVIPVLYRLGRNTLSNLLYFTSGIYQSNKSVPTDPATGLPQQLVNGASSLYLQGGDPKWADIDGDYRVTDYDYVTVGNPQPRIVGGINSYTTYRNFSLRISASYTLIRDLLNTNIAGLFRYYGDPTKISPLLPLNEYDYWKPLEGQKYAGSPAMYPNPFAFRRYGIIQPFKDNQTLFLEDGSYWKINTVTLAYNIPREKTKQYGITSTRIYLTANNLYTFSNYSGPDPENVTALGRDISGGYPSRRSFTVGINVQF